MEAEPPMKKAKSDLDVFLANLRNSDKNLTPVLKDEYLEKIQTVSFHAGHIKDNKLLSKAIQILNEKVPLGNVQYLKRVSRDSVLLCSEDYLMNTGFQNIQDFIEYKVPELKDAFDYFKIVLAPAKPPLTKLQHAEWRKQWPCNFHPNPYVEQLVSGEFFTQSELCLHRKYMAITLYLTKLKILVTKQELLSNINAAVVVDSNLQSIVTIALDNRENHPTQHAAMVGIDNVAKSQNGGVWTACIDKELFENIKSEFLVDFGVKNNSNSKKGKDLNTPYLCTGYDIYLLREPCLMCAMGLLHARVKRVFYLFENQVQGALKTKIKLHCLPGLNHRYEVYTGFKVS